MAFDQVYFGSTLGQYLIYFAIILGSFVAIKIVVWVIEKIFKKIASKTKSQLDDIFINSFRKPVVFLVFTLAIIIGKDFLSLSPSFSEIYDKIVYILSILSFTWFISGFLDSFLQTYLKPLAKKTSTDLDDGIIFIVRRVVKILVVILAIIMILDNVGINVTSLIAGLGLGGLAFALAAQDLLKNIFGGIAILTDKPFTFGQRIKIGTNIDGFVDKVGFRTTRIRTFDGTRLVVPNSQVADSIIENVSKERSRRIVIILGLEYATTSAKLEQAKNIVQKIVKANENTEDNSDIHFMNFGPSSLDLRVAYWIKNKEAILDAQHEINTEIKKEFEKAKLSFAFPTQTIHLKK